MSWLVTGGAGYIGAHIVHALRGRGEPVVVLDDLSTGDERRTGDAHLVVGSVLNEDLVRQVLSDHEVDGVVHIAAKKQVGESVAEPLRYYRENVTGLQSLLSAMAATGVRRMVYSSSAATYGMPDVECVTEDAVLRPLSPYGETKVVGEWLMAAQARATGLDYISLRYFNVAGAANAELGDQGVFNLIPLVFQALSRGERPRIFGDDYDTPDGTCVRDYVHVADIADAHVVALHRLTRGTCQEIYNVGRGQGASVREVIETVRQVTGFDSDPVVVERRPGDPARIVAAVDKIERDLDWRASRDLWDMVASGWAAWQHTHGAAPATTGLRSG